MKKVDLKELADHMDFMLDEWRYFIDKGSGEIVSIDGQYLGYAEELDEEEIEKIFLSGNRKRSTRELKY